MHHPCCYFRFVPDESSSSEYSLVPAAGLLSALLGNALEVSSARPVDALERCGPRIGLPLNGTVSRGLI